MFSEWVVFHDHYLFLVGCLLLLGCTFILAKRLIDWSFKKGRTYFLSYVVGSSLFLNLLFLIFVAGSKEMIASHFLPYLLQVIAVFGMLLGISLGVKTLYHYIYRKKA